MSLSLFEGPAGSGKTTHLLENLGQLLKNSPLREDERVLALTKMHGSRRRMHGRLSALPNLHGRFECSTVDSFAWRVIRRWRSLARAKGFEEPTGEDYNEICTVAGTLLSDPIVAGWVTNTFPIPMVDELQDSKGGQLLMIQALSNSTIRFI